MGDNPPVEANFASWRRGNRTWSVAALRQGIVAFLLATVAHVSPASAHHKVTDGPTSGIAIPSLTHGQMRILADSRRAILSLADDQWQTDPTFRTLRNFIALQHFACFNGLIPGSITDEASPFNECAHADLAALRSLLLHMTGMPGAETRAAGLKLGIDAALLRDGEALVQCRYSEEPFNTADIVEPDWSAIPTHGPTMAVIGGAFLVLSGTLLGLRTVVRA